MLGSVDSWLFTDVWGQPVSPIFMDYLTLEDGLSRNVGNCTPIYVADTPEERRSNLMHFFILSLKSFAFGVLGNGRGKLYAWYYMFKSKFSIGI